MKLTGFIENSLLDWEGRISAVLFVSGCNYACPFCHNPELATDSPDLPALAQDEVFARLRRFRDWLDGVVVTGGEPCAWPGLAGLLERLKGEGFAVKLDTNGSWPGKLAELLGKKLVDYAAMDVKAPFEREKYARLCGVSADPALPRESARLLAESGLPHEFRTTVVPGLLRAGDLEDIARSLGPRATYYLQKFKGGKTLSPALSGLEPWTEQDLQSAADACAKHVAKCGVRS